MAQDRAGGIGEGIRTGLGILNAFREALEETIEEAAARGDLSPERARVAMRDAADRVQGTLEEARERLDFVPRREFQQLLEEVAELRRRVEALERSGAPPRLEPGGAPDPGGAIPVD